MTAGPPPTAGSSARKPRAALIDRAERNGREVILATTAPQASDSGFGLTPMPAATAMTQLAAMEPSPWPIDRAAAADPLDNADLPRDLNIFWLSDGIASQKPATDTAFSDALWEHGALDVMSLKLDLPLMLLPPERDADGLWARVTRAQIGVAQPVQPARPRSRRPHARPVATGSFRAERVRSRASSSTCRSSLPTAPAASSWRTAPPPAPSRCWTMAAAASRSASSPTTRRCRASRCWATSISSSARWRPITKCAPTACRPC